MRILFILTILSGFIPAVWAQGTPSVVTPSGQTAAVSPEKKALILKLMEVTGSRDRLNQFLKYMKKSSPPSAAALMDKTINIDELLEKLIPIYDRNLTAEELQGLINFYNSDIGRKYILVMPVIMKESMQAGQDYVKDKILELKKQEVETKP